MRLIPDTEVNKSEVLQAHKACRTVDGGRPWRSPGDT